MSSDSSLFDLLKLNLAHMEHDWSGWINLRGVDHGKLKVRVEKLYPVESNIRKLLKTNLFIIFI